MSKAWAIRATSRPMRPMPKIPRRLPEIWVPISWVGAARRHIPGVEPRIIVANGARLDRRREAAGHQEYRLCHWLSARRHPRLITRRRRSFVKQTSQAWLLLLLFAANHQPAEVGDR